MGWDAKNYLEFEIKFEVNCISKSTITKEQYKQRKTKNKP